MVFQEHLKGVILMIIASIAVATGQFLWKLSAGDINAYMFIGFALYGIGALLMIVALKYGELSVLHPIMAFSYVVAFLLSVFVLHEPFHKIQLVGMVIIIIAVASLGLEQQKDDR